MESGIYIILNKCNHKSYIGSTVNFSERFAYHLWQLKNNRHKNTHLQSSFNLYGPTCFDFIILEHCNPENLLIREQLYIDSIEFAWLYNICSVAGNRLGQKTSPETRLKISQKAFGRKHTEEHKRKISLATKGRLVSEETREKHRKSSIFKAQNFTIQSPQGEIISVHNMKLFCQENNLNPTHMSSVIRGHRAHHKQWRKVNNE